MSAVPEKLRSYVADLDPERAVWVGGPTAADDGGTFAVHDPADDSEIAQVSDGGVSDAVRAVDAAADAFPAWAATAPRERGEALRKAFELMHAEAEELAGLMAWENGKSLADARAEVTYSAEFFRWFSEEAVRNEGNFGSSPAGGTRTIVTQRPVGVAAMVTPWNFPAAMATRKIGPALAAGCTVVLKPASETPLTALAVARILARAGVPEGVVNVVPTTSAGDVVTAWLDDSRVRKVSFTGSTGVGRHLLTQAADRVVNASMELGGNAPFVVGPDADIEAAVAGAMLAKFRNGGQACTAANRFYVHTDVIDDFVSRFGAEIETLTVGPAFEDNQIGPLITAQAHKKVVALVDQAVNAGARVAHRGDAPEGAGHFHPAMLLADVPADAALLAEEIFGPVAPVVAWSDDEEVLRLVNGTEFGLSAYVFGSLGWALPFAERIDAGMVGINRGLVSDPAAPFGGVKQSGIGREGGREGIREYLETQYFSVAWPS